MNLSYSLQIKSIIIHFFIIWNNLFIHVTFAKHFRTARKSGVYHHPGVLRGLDITLPCLTPSGKIEQNSELYTGDYILKYEWTDYTDMPLFGPRVKFNRRTGKLRISDSHADDTGLYKCSILYHAAGTKSYVHKVIVYDWAIPHERFEIDMYDPSTTSGKTIIPDEITTHIVNKLQSLLKAMYGEAKWINEVVSINGCSYNEGTKEESEVCYVIINIKPTKQPQGSCTGLCNLQAQKDELTNVAVRLHRAITILLENDLIVKKYLRIDSFRSQRYLACLPGFHLTSNDRCLPCHPGQYNVSKGSKCKPCTKGTYQEFYGKTHCIPCPDDKITDRVGQKSSSFCHSVSIGNSVMKAMEQYGEMLIKLFKGL